MTPSDNLSQYARDYVEGAVADCINRVPDRPAEMTHAIEQLVAWVERAEHGPLSHFEVLRDEIIEGYLATLTGMGTKRKALVRATLFRMAEVFLGSWPKGEAPFVSVPASRHEPYSPFEVAEIEKWAFGQPGMRSANAAALISLGLGAGLTADDIAGVRMSDLQLDSDLRITISVPGARRRSVLVDSDWTADVSYASEFCEPGDWFFRPNRKGGTGKTLVRDFIHGDSDVGLRPDPRRMRATFLAKRVSEGDSVVELMRVAGLTSFGALGRDVRFVQEPR